MGVSCSTADGSRVSLTSSGSHINTLEWTWSITCVRIVPTMWDGDGRYKRHLVSVEGKSQHVVRMPVSIEELLQPFAACTITGFTEWRQPWSGWQQWNPIFFYHAFAVLDVEGADGEELFICTEKYNDKLELMLGEGAIMRAFVQQYRATGDQRSYECTAQEKQKLNTPVQVLLDWISAPLAIVMQPYDFFEANCQHYVQDLHHVLLNPDQVDELRDRTDIVLSAVSQEGMRLQHASPDLRGQACIVRAAIEQNVEAFQFAADHLRKDRYFVLSAMASNVQALQFAAEELRNNPWFMADAMENGASGAKALQYASEELKGDRAFVLDAVQRSPLALKFASKELRTSREFVLEAIARKSAALKHASEELLEDQEFLLDVIAQRPSALQFVPEKFQKDPKFLAAAIDRNGICRIMAGSFVNKLRKSVTHDD